MSESKFNRISAAALRYRVFVWSMCLCLFAGCQTIRMPFAGYFEKKREEDISRMASTDGIQGPLQRIFNRKTAEASSLAPAAGREEFEKAEEQFKQGHFKEAEKLAKRVAKKYKNSPVREDALYLVAEAQYRQKKYSWAQDSYDKVTKEFPSSRYLEMRNQRLFEIAQYWLQDPQVVTSDNVQLAGFNHEGKRVNVQVDQDAQQKKKRGFDISRAVPIFPNFWDRSRPVFDTEGRALQALRSIWTSDPTGSLADDALMLTASHHLKKRNYKEADDLLKLIREEYPDSPHNKPAMILGGFVKQASYQGPAYDDRILDEAKRLKQTTMQLYPNIKQADRLRDDLREINLAKAAGDWEMVEFYRRKNNKKAMAVYCREVIRLYPETKYADMARAKLRELNGKPPAAARSKARDRRLRATNTNPKLTTPPEGNQSPSRNPLIPNDNVPGRVRVN